MSRNDARADRKLPVTGEVGSEGGSFADPTLQVAELEGEVGRSAEAADPVEPEQSDAQSRDSIKYPSE